MCTPTSAGCVSQRPDRVNPVGGALFHEAASLAVMLYSLRLLWFERWDATSAGRWLTGCGRCADLCTQALSPSRLVFSVMGRICPWELGHYALRGRFRRAGVRAARGATAVGMNHHTIWTRYYLPREFYRAFAEHFSLAGYRALSLFMPPPYLVEFYRRRRQWCDRLGRLDDRLGEWPLLRDMGDHFLMVMRRR